jgi:hypothetical protein
VEPYTSLIELATCSETLFGPMDDSYKALLKYTDKKENQIFLLCKEIQIRAVAKLYMRKGFLIYEEMRKYFPIYEEAVSHI